MISQPAVGHFLTVYRKTKISHDPNNTKWARSTSGFGHRIMSAQGWTPGNRLGARDAAHADFLTAASTSHIKVTIKDDTLGLGARAGRDPLGEPTGLDAFKGLLGRLNGKSDVELKQDQRKRDDVKLARYAAMKFPEVRFVYGGLLTHEKREALPDLDTHDRHPKAHSESGDRSGREEATSSASESPEPKRKSSKSKTRSKSKSKSKSKSSKKSHAEADERDDSSSISESKKRKKSKKRKADADDDATSDPQVESQPESSSSTSMARERRPIGRQVFRGRHIAQKKKALMDDKSLQEVSSKIRSGCDGE